MIANTFIHRQMNYLSVYDLHRGRYWCLCPLNTYLSKLNSPKISSSLTEGFFFLHVLLGSCVLIALKEFMGVITLRNCDIHRKINPPGRGGGRGELQTLSAGLLLFLSVYFMGV